MSITDKADTYKRIRELTGQKTCSSLGFIKSKDGAADIRERKNPSEMK